MSKLTKKSDTHEERYYHVPVDSTNSRLRMVTIYARRSLAGQWSVMGAFCHRDDPFDRAVGRQIARRRYFAGRHKPIVVPGDMTYARAVELARIAANIFTA